MNRQERVILNGVAGQIAHALTMMPKPATLDPTTAYSWIYVASTQLDSLLDGDPVMIWPPDNAPGAAS